MATEIVQDAPVRLQLNSTVETSIKVDNFGEWLNSLSHFQGSPGGVLCCKSFCSKVITVRSLSSRSGDDGQDFIIDLGVDLFNDVGTI